MTPTCRESCGVCGFLAPNNKEEQVVGEKSYTDIKKADFDCGRNKNLFDIEKNTPSKAKELLELLEDPTCEDWVSQGECVKAPKLMNHFCRESCGEGNGEFSIFSYLQESIYFVVGNFYNFFFDLGTLEDQVRHDSVPNTRIQPKSTRIKHHNRTSKTWIFLRSNNNIRQVTITFHHA